MGYNSKYTGAQVEALLDKNSLTITSHANTDTGTSSNRLSISNGSCHKWASAIGGLWLNWTSGGTTLNECVLDFTTNAENRSINISNVTWYDNSFSNFHDKGRYLVTIQGDVAVAILVAKT